MLQQRETLLPQHSTWLVHGEGAVCESILPVCAECVRAVCEFSLASVREPKMGMFLGSRSEGCPMRSCLGGLALTLLSLDAKGAQERRGQRDQVLLKKPRPRTFATETPPRRVTALPS